MKLKVESAKNLSIGAGIVKEGWRPLPFLGTATVFGRILFYLRIIFDLRLNAIFCSARKLFPQFSGRVLDVGCGAQPWRFMLPHCQYTGLEVMDVEEKYGYKENKDIVYHDGRQFPFHGESFNHIICTEVLEHVPDPQQFLTECYFCLKKGGVIFLTVPFSARYHYIPHDFWRFTSAALKLLFEGAGFEQVIIRPLGTDVCVIINKITILFMKLLLPSRGHVLIRLIKMFFGIIFLPAFFVLTFIGLLSVQFKIGSHDDPMGYEVLAVKSYDV